MAQQKRGLGKGLGALIPTTPVGGVAELSGATDSGADQAEAVASIAPNPRQPRQIFDEEALAELAASIKAVGLLQPIVLRKVEAGQYQIVMGERRWRACQLAELDVVPAI